MIPHWDLTPREQVTLTSAAGGYLNAVFLFRDTVRACLLIDGELREFGLTREGRLSQPLGEWPSTLHRVWSVEGEPRNTRTVVHWHEPQSKKEERDGMRSV